jgi:cytochrome c556
MNQLVYEREMTALQKQEIRTKKLEDLVDTISELVNSADGMTKALPGLKLNKHDQITFRAMANQLLDEAKNIRQFAENNDYLSVESVYQDLDDTCNACHRLFRY